MGFERRKFAEDYWIFTFEGMVVALFIATVSLIGVSRFLILPALCQVVVIWCVVRYKALKINTEKALETSFDEEKRRVFSGKTEPLTDDALLDKVEVNYFNQHGTISNQISAYQAIAGAFLFISIFGVIGFPLYQESEKNQTEIQREVDAKERERKILESIDSLRPGLETLTQEIRALNQQIATRGERVRNKQSGADASHGN